MFTEQVKREEMRVVFQEYAWDMGWCDPCAADPLSNEELLKLGVFWLADQPPTARPLRAPRPGGPQNVFVTRMHVRYDAQHFPEDLVFQETADRQNFQGRYVLRHPWTVKSDCPAAEKYQADLQQRQRNEAETLATLTGWNIADIYNKIGLKETPGQPKSGDKWYQKIWKD
jgi:hypothetical protein